MIRAFLAASTATLAFATSALAGPIDVPPPPPPVVIPVMDEPFEGPYVGLEFGTVRPDISAIESGDPDEPLLFDDGRALGVFGGYNIQNGNLVYGGELRYLAFDGVESEIDDFELTRTVDLRGRVGLAAGNALFYGALGYSWVQMDDAGTDISLDGMNYGLGAEYNVTESLFLGVDLTRRDVSGSEGGISYEGDVDTATLRVGFRF